MRSNNSAWISTQTGCPGCRQGKPATHCLQGNGAAGPTRQPHQAVNAMCQAACPTCAAAVMLASDGGRHDQQLGRCRGAGQAKEEVGVVYGDQWALAGTAGSRPTRAWSPGLELSASTARMKLRC
jgi:hypothetical protein